MSSELSIRTGVEGGEVTAILWVGELRWDGESLVAPASIADEDWADGAIELTEGDDTYYFADMPDGFPAAIVDAYFYDLPPERDLETIGHQILSWSGSAIAADDGAPDSVDLLWRANLAGPLCRQVCEMSNLATKNCGVDLSDVLTTAETVVGDVIVSCEPAGLTFANQSPSIAQLTTASGVTIAAGKAVQFAVSSSGPDYVTYKVTVQFSTSSSPSELDAVQLTLLIKG